MSRILGGQSIPEHPPPVPDFTPRNNNNNKARQKKRVKKKKELGIYPEVLLALGFEFVKEDLKITDDMQLPLPAEGDTAM